MFFKKKNKKRRVTSDDFNITVDVNESDPVFCDLMTEGLQQFSLPELALRSVHKDLVLAAATVVNTFATYISENDVNAGEHIGIEYDDASLVGRLLESKPNVWDIVDPGKNEFGTPWLLLSDAALLRASMLFEQSGDSSESSTFLMNVIPLFPIDDGPELNAGLPVNWNHARSYLFLARLTEGTVRRDLVDGAMRRSAVVSEELLGTDVENLQNTNRAYIGQLAELLLSTQQALESRELDGSNSIYVGPIWNPTESGAELSLTALPSSLVEHYSRAVDSMSPTELGASLSEIWTAHQEDPIALGTIVFDTIKHFSSSDDAPRFHLETPRGPSDFLMSALFATLLRMVPLKGLSEAAQLIAENGTELWSVLGAIDDIESTAKLEALGYDTSVFDML